MRQVNWPWKPIPLLCVLVLKKHWIWWPKQASEKGLELAYRLNKDVPTVILGDAIRIRQILLNLLSNAIKFTGQGEVTVSASLARLERIPAEVRPVTDMALLHFQVKDTGIGIPADRLEDLFDAFAQADSSTTRRYGGTGLGLTISKRLSRMMKGGTWAESTVGEGSTFHFVIQAATYETEDVPILKQPQPLLQGKRALIAERNAFSCEVLREYTEAWGMLSQATATTDIALACLQDQAPFDVVILDAHLLSTSQCERIKQRCPHLLFILTAPSAASSEAAFMDAVLHKPLKPAHLLKTLIELMDTGEATPTEEESLFDSGMAAREPLNILLVEDNQVNQKVAQLLLGRLGYLSDVVDSGRKALAAIAQQDYDVVLMDVQMSDMDGLVTTRRIREQTVKQPYIIAMTANAMEGDREKCLEVGMNSYLSKPVEISALTEALELAAESKK